jgi:hypothetical protein
MRSRLASFNLAALRRIALPVGLATLAGGVTLSAASCSTDKPAGPKACCDQPKAPPGIPPFTVTMDDVSGPTDGQKVKLRAAMKQKTKRDDMYLSLQFLYRYIMTRDPSFPPISLVGELYTSEGEAQSGSNPAAKIWREQSDSGPKCENNVPYDFAEQIDRAFAYSLNRAVPEDLADTCHLAEKKKEKRFDDDFKHKPSYKVDVAGKAVEVTYPYLDTGKDAYVPSITFNNAMTYWAEFTSSMFNKAPDLKELTYVGLLDDAPAMKITVTRAEFDSKLSTVQETIASYAAITFAKLGLHKTDDKGARKDQEQQKTKTYKAALSFLPKERVFVSPKLKT